MLASALNKSDAHNAFSDSFVRAKKIGSQLQRSSSSIYERKEQKMLAVSPTLNQKFQNLEKLSENGLRASDYLRANPSTYSITTIFIIIVGNTDSNAGLQRSLCTSEIYILLMLLGRFPRNRVRF